MANKNEARDEREVLNARSLHTGVFVRRAVHAFVRSYAVTFGARAALALVQRLVAVLRQRSILPVKKKPIYFFIYLIIIFFYSKLIADLRSLFTLSHGVALAVGVLSGGALLLRALIHRVALATLHRKPIALEDVDTAALQRADLHPAVGVIAGGVAGCAALKLLGGDKSIALYAFVRLLQSAYNDARQRQIWPDDAGPFFNALRSHGDALLFMVTTGQVMFAYVCAPWSLPRSYYHFILNTGPMHEVGLQTMRRRNFSRPLDVNAMRAYYAEAGGERHHGPFPADILGVGAATSTTTTTTTTTVTHTVQSALSAAAASVTTTRSKTLPIDVATAERWLLPCSVLHPHTGTCTHASVLTFKNAFRRSFPVYSTVFGVAALFRIRQSLRAPGTTLAHIATSSVRSTTFLATFVAACMALVCVIRRMMPWEMWPAYWALSFVAASSIFIERKSRRSELALYVLPRALDSAYLILSAQRPALRVADGLKRYALFAAACGGLFHYYLHKPSVLHPLLVKVLDFLVRDTDGDSSREFDDEQPPLALMV